jgi:hypothetical protein
MGTSKWQSNELLYLICSYSIFVDHSSATALGTAGDGPSPRCFSTLVSIEGFLLRKYLDFIFLNINMYLWLNRAFISLWRWATYTQWSVGPTLLCFAQEWVAFLTRQDLYITFW